MANTIKYAFRLTHIENIPCVLRCGLVRANSPLRDENYVSIGDRQVIQLREERLVQGYRLSDYVPFYFGPRSPMLYVIQHGYNRVQRIGPEQIVYCVVRIEDLVHDGIDGIFTDGHALSGLSSFFDIQKLSQVNDYVSWDDVYSTQWNVESDIDLKRRKEAELLINVDLPAQYIRGFVVYNERAKARLEEMGVKAAMIAVRPKYYF